MSVAEPAEVVASDAGAANWKSCKMVKIISIQKKEIHESKL